MYLNRYIRVRHFKKLLQLWVADKNVLKTNISIQEKTLLLVKTEAIGDYILFRNFIEIVRNSKKFADYKITFIGNELWKDLAISLDAKFVDDFIWINRKKFIDDILYRQEILSHVAKQGFEYAVQANHSREFAYGDSIIRASKAPYRIGSRGDSANDLGLFKWISNSWYTQLIHKNKDAIFEFDKNRIFFEEVLQEKLGITIPIIYLNNNNTIRNGIIIFPGAGEKIKQWSTKNFAELIRKIREQNKEPIYICGSPTDNILANEIIQECKGLNIENYCGKTTILQLTEMITQSALLITNDSSALHIAAATKTQTICMFMGRHFGRFTPYPKEANWVHIVYPQSFLPLLQYPEKTSKQTEYHSPATIDEISVEQVFNKYLELKDI